MGIPAEGGQVKFSAYADDILLYISDPELSGDPGVGLGIIQAIWIFGKFR